MKRVLACDDGSAEEKQTYAFIFLRLLEVGACLSIKDSAQWEAITKVFVPIVVNDRLFDVFTDYIPSVMRIFSRYFPSEKQEDFLDLVFDIVNAINHPEDPEKEAQAERYVEELKAIDTTLSDKLDQRANATADIDPDDSESIQDEIALLRARKREIVEAQNKLNDEVKEEMDPRMLTDHLVMQRILNVFLGFYKSILAKNDLTRVPAFIQSQIVINLESPYPEIVKLSMHILAHHCLFQPYWINFFLKVYVEVGCSPISKWCPCLKPFLAQIMYNQDYGDNRVQALCIITDFVFVHGFGPLAFMVHEGEQNPSDPNRSTVDTTGVIDRCNHSTFKEFFFEMVDEFLSCPVPFTEKDSIRYKLFDAAVKGVCRLVYRGRIESPAIIRQLLMFCTDSDASSTMDRKLINFVQGTLLAYTDKLKKNTNRLTGVAECFQLLTQHLDQLSA